MICKTHQTIKESITQQIKFLAIWQQICTTHHYTRINLMLLLAPMEKKSLKHMQQIERLGHIEYSGITAQENIRLRFLKLFRIRKRT